MKIMQIIRKKAYTNVTAKYHYGDEKCKCLSCILILLWTMRGELSLLGKLVLTCLLLECLYGCILGVLTFYFGHLMQRTDSTEKNPDAEKDWRQEEKGTIEDEMVGWHHQLNGHEFEEAPGVGDWQGSPWDGKESDMTEWLNWHFILSVFTQ